MSMSIPSDTFRYARHYSNTFVETGTYHCGGIFGATMAGFERMFSCEASAEIQAIAKSNMGDQWGRIKYYLGDSATELPKMLKDADTVCVVLLDAHVMGGDWMSAKSRQETGRNCPLREEMRALAADSRHNHLVLVDDVDLCGTDHLDYITLSEIMGHLLQINNRYQFSLINGIRPRMMLVAVPPGFRHPEQGQRVA